MPLLRRIRDEFRLHRDRFFPRHRDPVRFYTTPWLTNQAPFLVYRLLLCVYNMAVLVLYAGGSYWAWNPKVLITLTYQTYVLLVSPDGSSQEVQKSPDNATDSNHPSDLPPPLPWYIAWQWILFTVPALLKGSSVSTMPLLRRIRDEFRLHRFFPRHHDPVRFYTTPWLTNQTPFLVYRLLLCVYNVAVLVVYAGGSYWAWDPKVLTTLSYQTYILWTVYSTWSAVVCFVLYFGCSDHPAGRQIESCSLVSPDGSSQEVQESPDNADLADDPSCKTESYACDTATPAEHTMNDSHSRFGTTLDAAALLQGYLRDDSNRPPTETVTSPPDPRLPWYLALQWVLFTAPAVCATPITVVFWSFLKPSGSSIVIGDILLHGV
ncbi:Hypp3277 [Branchiostoma lanceolatum]|uniref:Hypp3277 protein n=1 Tax=Branchiostoma lanceolatum TaxID=7740 RepID=A0A8K0A1T1_BRALA|nr:Hypp3277 [Branchiostoma lanceolatum]